MGIGGPVGSGKTALLLALCLKLRDRYEPGASLEPAASFAPAADRAPEGARDGWRPISLYPWATRQATLRLLAFLVAALIVIDLSALGQARRAMVSALVASGAEG